MATDFFDRQDAARRETGRLVVLFVVAVILIIAAVYAALTGILIAMDESGRPGSSPPIFDPIRLAIVAVGTGGVILLGSAYKILSLREGGSAVAQLLGGRLLDPNTADRAERRLLNVVEEMALASGTPVPPVYLMDEEEGINAFAAGYAPGDAVIGMTRGSIEHLNRDQLQGVVAHEFSHILNGDMRLDLKLMGIVHGILLLAILGEILIRMTGGHGRHRSRSSSDKKDNGAALFLLMGVALYAIGFLGVFFGRLIKSAVSRQREFLADASAVQFTRNPEGLAGALKKIGGLAAGSKLTNPNAEQACHMFFSKGVSSMTSLMATHPPLEERIKRLDPNFDGQFTFVAPDEQVPVEDARPSRKSKGPGGLGSMIPGVNIPGGLGGAILLPSAGMVESVGSPRPEHSDYAGEFLATLPDEVAQALREPFGASAVVYALLLDPGVEIRAAQFQGLAQHAAPGIAEEATRLAPILERLGPEARVPLVDLALPTLRMLSLEQYKRFRSNIDPLVRADNRVSLFEFALQRMLLRHLDRQFEHPTSSDVRYTSLTSVGRQVEGLLSTISWAGHVGATPVNVSFDQGRQRLGPEGQNLSLWRREESTLKSVGENLDVLVLASPAIKKMVLEACAAIVSADNQVTVSEAELMRAIADSLDCPMPPMMAEATRGVGSRGHAG